MKDDVCAPSSIRAHEHGGAACPDCGRAAGVEQSFRLRHWLWQGLFLALCSRRGLRPYTKGRGKKAAEELWVRAPDGATIDALWAEYQELQRACDDAVLVTANEFCKARLGCELPIARAR